MKNTSKLEGVSGFHLIKVDIVDDYTDEITTSYEVLDAEKGVVGRFAGLTEAESYIKLLCRLDIEV